MTKETIERLDGLRERKRSIESHLVDMQEWEKLIDDSLKYRMQITSAHGTVVYSQIVSPGYVRARLHKTMEAAQGELDNIEGEIEEL